MSADKVVLGLVIGTANARVATAICPAAVGSVEAGLTLGLSSLSRPETVVNADGDRGTPSVVARRDTEWLVGEAAKAALSGRDPSVQVWLGDAIARGLRGETPEDEEDTTTVADNEICGQLIQQVLEQAQNFSGENPSDCVVVVPAWYSEKHRAAVIHNANMSGLTVVGVIREPFAILLSYMMTNPTGLPSKGEAPTYIVVFDFGASHLDISVIESKQGLLRLLHTDTHKNLGGAVVVEKLVNFCAADFRKKTGCDVTESKRAMTKLRRECETGLKVLSTSTQTDIEIDSLYEGCDLRIRVTRARFEGELFDVMRACMTAVDAALDNAGLTKEEVDLMLLAGAAVRIPKLQSTLRGSFPESVLVKPADNNPEEASALGGAIQAQLLYLSADRFPEVVGHPVMVPLPTASMAFAISHQPPGAADAFFPVIKKGQLLPAEMVVKLSKAEKSMDTGFLRIFTSSDDFASASSAVLVGELPVDFLADAEVQLCIHLGVTGMLRMTLRGLTSAQENTVEYHPASNHHPHGQGSQDKAPH